MIASPARAQTACGPWVSDAYNNAFAGRVGQLRKERRAVGSSRVDAAVPPCDDNQGRTDFELVSDFGGEADTSPAAPDHEAVEIRDGAHTARLNEIVVVRVQHLRTLVDQAQCIDRGKAGRTVAKIPGCSTKEILLFLDGRPIEGLLPEAIAVDAAHSSGTLRYHLERKPQAKETWADLVGLDLQGLASASRNVRLSVGLAGSDPIPTAVTGFHLVRIRGRWLMVWMLVAGLALWLFYRIATRTDLLRDRYPYVERGQRRPFSLAHCQAAWWTGLTLFAFAFIWLVTGQRDFSPTALSLLGITAGTALGSRIIDANRPTTTTNVPNDAALQAAMQSAIDEKRRLEAAVEDASVAASRSGAPADRNAVAAARVAYQDFLDQVRRTFPQLIAPASQGFLTDIVSDSAGVTFHRFQMAAWAAVLGLIFVVEVLSRLAMPEFDANLLALLGISAGTYLGLKVPERT